MKLKIGKFNSPLTLIQYIPSFLILVILIFSLHSQYQSVEQLKHGGNTSPVLVNQIDGYDSSLIASNVDQYRYITELNTTRTIQRFSHSDQFIIHNNETIQVKISYISDNIWETLGGNSSIATIIFNSPFTKDEILNEISFELLHENQSIYLNQTNFKVVTLFQQSITDLFGGGSWVGNQNELWIILRLSELQPSYIPDDGWVTDIFLYLTQNNFDNLRFKSTIDGYVNKIGQRISQIDNKYKLFHEILRSPLLDKYRQIELDKNWTYDINIKFYLPVILIIAFVSLLAISMQLSESRKLYELYLSRGMLRKQINWEFFKEYLPPIIFSVLLIIVVKLFNLVPPVISFIIIKFIATWVGLQFTGVVWLILRYSRKYYQNITSPMKNDTGITRFKVKKINLLGYLLGFLFIVYSLFLFVSRPHYLFQSSQLFSFPLIMRYLFIGLLIITLNFILFLPLDFENKNKNAKSIFLTLNLKNLTDTRKIVFQILLLLIIIIQFSNYTSMTLFYQQTQIQENINQEHIGDFFVQFSSIRQYFSTKDPNQMAAIEGIENVLPIRISYQRFWIDGKFNVTTPIVIVNSTLYNQMMLSYNIHDDSLLSPTKFYVVSSIKDIIGTNDHIGINNQALSLDTVATLTKYRIPTFQYPLLTSIQFLQSKELTLKGETSEYILLHVDTSIFQSSSQVTDLISSYFGIQSQNFFVSKVEHQAPGCNTGVFQVSTCMLQSIINSLNIANYVIIALGILFWNLYYFDREYIEKLRGINLRFGIKRDIMKYIYFQGALLQITLIIGMLAGVSYGLYWESFAHPYFKFKSIYLHPPYTLNLIFRNVLYLLVYAITVQFLISKFHFRRINTEL